MKIACLSDIHGNLEALEACLADARRCGADTYAFLGDLVGYGADPVACLEAIAGYVDQGAAAIRGNHDQAAIDGWCEDMHFMARDAIYWTRGQLAASHRDFLESLPLTARIDDLLLVHGEPESPSAFHYVTGAWQAEAALAATDARIVAAGHVHNPMLYTRSGDAAPSAFRPVAGTPIPLLPRRQWFAIVGSCGQPRDGNPAAGYAILDTDSGQLCYRRVPYDHDAAAHKILAAGLPEYLALRLALGH